MDESTWHDVIDAGPVAVPLQDRVRIGRSIGRVLSGFGLLTLLLATLAAPDRLAVPVGTLAWMALLPVAVMAYVGWGRWPDRLDEPGCEALLQGAALVAVAAPLAVLGVGDGTGAADIVLPLPLLGAALTVRPTFHKALTFGTGSTLLLVAGLVHGDAVAAVVPAGTCVAVGLLASRATAVLAGTLASAEASRRRAARLARSLHSVADAAAGAATADPQEVLEVVVGATVGIRADVAAVLVHDDDGMLRVGAHHRMAPRRRDQRWSPDTGLAGQALRDDRTVTVDDYSNAAVAHDELRPLGLRGAVAAPIHLDGEVAGVLFAGRRADEPITAEDVLAIELLTTLAGRALALSRRIDDDRRTVARLRTLNEQQADFVATVSHELRTPVTIVDGLVSTLREHRERLDPARWDALFDRLAANSASLATIVTSLLDAATLDAGLVPDEGEVDLATLVRGSVQRLTSVLADHDVHVTTSPRAIVRGDEALLQRVVDNLLTNVERHTPHGTAVVVECVVAHGQVVVRVVDHGPGIPPELLSTVARRFVRVGDHHRRTSRGLGIGLSLAAEVLRLHGSRLEVGATEGGGTTCAFALPHAPDQPLTASPSPEVTTGSPAQRLTGRSA